MSAENLNNWIVIYRAYSGPDLAAEAATLRRWLSNPYDAQTQGSKSYQRNVSNFTDRLVAIQRVLNEQSMANVPSYSQMDASGGIWGGAGSIAANNGGAAGAYGYPNSWN